MDDLVSAALERVQNYWILVEGAVSTSGEINTLINEKYLECMGIFKIRVLRIHSDGSSSEEKISTAYGLLATLQECLVAKAEESATSDWIYFIVEDLNPAVISLLGGFLEIPPQFFLSPMAGGGLIQHPTDDREEEPEEVSVNFL